MTPTYGFILLNEVLAKDFLPLIEKRKIVVYLSNELLRELARALTYPRIEAIFEKAGVDPKATLSSILKSSKFVETRRSVDKIKEDPADNRVLECALAARAEFIISGDKHLLALDEFRGIEILRARDFLETQMAERCFEFLRWVSTNGFIEILHDCGG